MPKLKRSAEEEYKSSVVAKIRYGMHRHDMPPKKMALLLGIDVTTYNRHLKSPEKFTLGELMMIARILHLPIGLIVDGKEIGGAS